MDLSNAFSLGARGGSELSSRKTTPQTATDRGLGTTHPAPHHSEYALLSLVIDGGV